MTPMADRTGASICAPPCGREAKPEGVASAGRVKCDAYLNRITRYNRRRVPGKKMDMDISLANFR
jgi:hypothetical protein